MSNLKLIPDPVEIREIFYTNLLLLGFDSEAYEAQYRIPFNKDMFSVPNRKCMEVVFYFLFKKLNQDLTSETFRHCWPIIDKKTEQEFRKLTIEWITKIKKDEQECYLPNVTLSLLLSPSGEKFYQFLFYFSIYILKQKTKAISKKDFLPLWINFSSFGRKFPKQVQRSLMSNVVSRKDRLIDFLMGSFSAKHVWTEYARDLNKECFKLHKQIKECENNIKGVQCKMMELLGKSSFSSADTIKRTESMQLMKTMWDSITKLYELQKKIHLEVKKTIDQTHSFSLDGDAMTFNIPTILVKDCERMLHYGKRFQNVYKDGNLNIISLVELWNLSLQRVKASLNQNPLHHVNHEETYVHTEASNHANYLNHLESIRLTLTKSIIPGIDQSIKDLEESLCGFSCQENSKFFDLISTSPPFHFDFNVGDNNHHNKTQKLLKDEYDLVATPYAVNDLLCRLNDFNQDKTPFQLQKVYQKNDYIVPTSSALNTNSIIKKNNIKEFHPKHSQATDKSIAFSRIPRCKIASSSCEVHNSKVDDNLASSVSNNITSQFDGEKRNAHEILLEQIARSVLNVKKNDAESSSDEESEKNMHALENPFEAFSKNPFLNQDKCIRTPGPKYRKNISSYTSPASTLDDRDLSSSFLELTPVREPDTPFTPFSKPPSYFHQSNDYNLLTPFHNSLSNLNVSQRSSQNISELKSWKESSAYENSRSTTELSDILPDKVRSNFSGLLRSTEDENSSCFEHGSLERTSTSILYENFSELSSERCKIGSLRGSSDHKTPNLISFLTPTKHINITNKDVDDFIEEVVSNTPGCLMKTPATNILIKNNFYLITPGLTADSISTQR